MTQTRLRALVTGAATVALLAVGTPAVAAPATVDSGYLDWGFKASFRAYVNSGNGTPPIAASGGATINSNGTFRFPVTGGSYDADNGATSITYGGTVVFSHPAHFFKITLSNPSLVLNGATRVLKGDVVLETTGGGVPPVSVVQSDIATIGAGTPTVDGSTVTFTALSATLTEAGASAFNGFYSAGTALDAVSSAVTLAGGTDPGTPGGGTAQQELAVEIPNGPLSLSSTGGTVTLAGGSIGGTAAGALNPSTVSDLRGTNAGWNLVGQVEDFTGSAGTIGAANLGWTPTATAANGSAAVTPGATATGLNTGRTLCKAAAGASAGVFTCGGELSLAIPATAAPGAYTATLTLTLS
ncbi:hypothetical protein Val02_58450 [Virgisporangium aliadipatigenens]|uniref:Htaa domain-containing protein n=1 Tax=Virgisporangium aliadipatigenens TaxID=741659 RepID=A0A8J3YNS9_9ACTN|nr:HtaA domain-containing protein [Virgisporangium aliadipatigenens]GIJ48959.1 hypothetical protein Val02_58450 [Virgisporangium aliadipatigenens]